MEVGGNEGRGMRGNERRENRTSERELGEENF